MSFEDRQDLPGHRSGRITTHHSQAELTNLSARSGHKKIGRAEGISRVPAVQWEVQMKAADNRAYLATVIESDKRVSELVSYLFFAAENLPETLRCLLICPLSQHQS